jgi:CelD/BcsL family acetyltransferase involved in cellulose biosynthesis
MQMPEWLDFHWRLIAPTYLAVLRRQLSNDVIGVTPLVERKYPLVFSIAGWRLATLDVPGVLLVGSVPLFPPSEGYDALCRAVLALPSVDCFYMLGVPKTSAFWTFLAKARSQRSEWLFYTPNVDFTRYLYIDMKGTFDEYAKKFKPKTLQTLRRKLRVLEKSLGGKLELVRVRSAGDVESFLPGALAIAENSWQRQLIEVDVVVQNTGRSEFLKAMAGKGIMRSYLLKSGNKNVAYLIGFQLNGIFYFHETAYDQAYAPLSPGTVLLYLIIKDCFETDKPEIFHFGMGEFGYKRLLSNRSEDEVTVMVLRDTAANRAKVMAHRFFRRSIEVVKSTSLSRLIWRRKPPE